MPRSLIISLSVSLSHTYTPYGVFVFFSVTFSVNCLCFFKSFFSFSSSHTYTSYFIQFFFLYFFPLSVTFPLFPPPPFLSLFTFLTHSFISGLWMWRPTEAIRTDGLRRFPGSTHFYRNQPGTAAAVIVVVVVTLSPGFCRSRCRSIPSEAFMAKTNFWTERCQI